MILVADLHLTDNPKDSYRWDLFPWLKEQVQKTNSKEVLILGDLTDKKDKHSATLVNRVVESLLELANDVVVCVLAGNHDYIDPAMPFFGFLSLLEHNNIAFAASPCAISFSSRKALLLPHTKDPDSEWKELDFKKYGLIFCHQTFSGCKASNGQILEGMNSKYFSSRGFTGKVFSGDIHVPQHIGDVEYVGSPYHVHFGDDFKPRVIHLDLDGGKQSDLFMHSPRKLVAYITEASDLTEAKLKKDDQVKVRVVLDRSELVDWESIRIEIEKECAKIGAVLSGVEVIVDDEQPSTDKDSIPVSDLTPKTVLERFMEKEKLPDFEKEIGRKITSEL